jgi:hypothetical protein
MYEDNKLGENDRKMNGRKKIIQRVKFEEKSRN